MRPNLAFALAAAAALASCSGRPDARSREEAFAGHPSERPQAFDFARPAEALRLGAGEIAARAGSFAWEGEASWTVARGPTPPLPTTERHRLRQLATGEFEVASEIDPGLGPGSETGRDVVYSGGMTYARNRWAPWRERPTDRGRDARRQRDDSFRLAGSIADLAGPALAVQAGGEVTALGRRARRYVLSLSGALPTDPPPPPGLPASGLDPDTRRRLDFLGGRVPTALAGELLLDAATGAPLAVRLSAVFTERADPQLRAEVTVSAHVTALGAAVPAVRAPGNALADERKPKGVARALEAAGLRRRSDRGAAEPEEDEAGDEEPSR
ncbi:MAG TPA: hypothetical protein VFP65_18145 [Anaeromyxobacteraceae bacterium]|nr:hypothetical protein [Anaeromyxobacteraceae bacterium]